MKTPLLKAMYKAVEAESIKSKSGVYRLYGNRSEAEDLGDHYLYVERRVDYKPHPYYHG